MVRNLEKGLRDDIYEKITMLSDESQHVRLKVHKLHGRMNGLYSFSVNYKMRVVFEKTSKKTYLCHIVGDHSLYE